MFRKNSLGSDNHSGIHPQVLQSLISVNEGHSPAYGTDELTEQFLKDCKNIFGNQAETFCVFNGTAANVLCLKALVESYESIVVAETSHLHVDECGAPEAMIGAKLLTIPTANGKITPKQIEKFLIRGGDQHYSQPKCVSITQSTEYGTVYSFEEIKELREFTRKHGLYLHVDGARFIYAANYLQKSIRELTGDIGIDALSFGGTKNGLLFGELVVLFHPEHAKKMKYIRKQNMQLPSKHRFLAAQFQAFFKNNLWREIAQKNHQVALYLRDRLVEIPEVKITQDVQANAVFATIPRPWVKSLKDKFFFYIWNEQTFEARLMISFDVLKTDIDDFVNHIKEISKTKMNT